MKNQFVYNFNDGNKEMKNILGGKGANLAEMKKIGLPVPPGFTITTEACNKYYEDNKKVDSQIIEEIYENLKKMEKETGKIFGNPDKPL